MSNRRVIGSPTTFSNVGSATNITLSGRAVQSGSLLVVFIRWEPTLATATISDSAGGKNWRIFNHFNSNIGSAIAYCWQHPGGSNVVVTVDFGGTSVAYRYAAILELSGPDYSDPLEFSPIYISGSSGAASKLFVPGSANSDSFLAAGTFSAYGTGTQVFPVIPVYVDAYNAFSRNPYGAAGGRSNADTGGSGNFAGIAISLRGPSRPKRILLGPPVASGNIYTITPSGGIAFSGTESLRRTHVQPVSGSIAFSGTAALRRTHVQPVSGGIVFSGAVPLLRTRTQVPSGQVTFGGTAPITFVPATGGTVYTITPSGGITFSGTEALRRTKVQPVSGGIAFSGTASLLRTRTMVPSGSITFSGTVPLVRTRVQIPSGQIVFSGSAGIVFIPAGSATAVNLNRISMGLDRAHRLS